MIWLYIRFANTIINGVKIEKRDDKKEASGIYPLHFTHYDVSL